MMYLEFYRKWINPGLFNINQVLAWYPEFQQSNLSRWIKKDYIVKLRKEWYIFKEKLDVPGIQYLIGNKLYQPSYVSLQTALCFYGIIPESVMDVTSVCTIDSKSYSTEISLYSYQKVRPDLFFGYRLIEFENVGTVRFATPEKAILDFLYLNPFYKTEQDMADLRFDEWFMCEDLDKERLRQMLSRYKNKSLETRISKLLQRYD